MKNFDWGLAKSFLMVLEHGSITAAAHALGVSQPTLGRQIETLEKQLGVVLFQRGRAGASPTEAAYCIADHARSIDQSANALALAATGQSEALAGTIRITASQVVSTYLMPQVLAGFLDQEREIDVELVASNALENLTARDADIAVRMARPEQPELIAKKINEMSIGAYVSKEYLDRHDFSVQPSDIAELNGQVVIGYETTPEIINGFASVGIQVDRNYFRFRCDDQVTCIHALENGLGIGFAPKFVAARYPDLVQLQLDYELPSLPIWLVSHKELRSNRRIRTVFDYLSESLGNMELS